MEELEQKLIMILYECNQHVTMILHAYQRLKEKLPLTTDTYTKLSLDEKCYIDQFVFRFSKLQDTMGEKLFATMMYLLGEDFSKKPLIDLLNRLEKMELLSTDDWLYLRKMRNIVTHEYSLLVDELVESLNELFKSKDIIVTIYSVFYQYCKDRFEFVRKSSVL
jgi:thymidine kinase